MYEARMITLYGITRSRAARCLWMLEEVGVPYERVLTDQRKQGNRQPDYLAINPNGRLPALRDGDLTLFESMAINLYLADRYGQGLLPGSAEDRGRCYQWSVWVVTEVEAHALKALQHTALLPEEQRSPEAHQQAVESLNRPLAVLEGALAGRECLLGGAFSVADLNVASVLAWTLRAKVPLDGFPRVKDWMARCLARPGQQKVLAELRASA
jgi:glutathione S-transferase